MLTTPLSCYYCEEVIVFFRKEKGEWTCGKCKREYVKVAYRQSKSMREPLP